MATPKPKRKNAESFERYARAIQTDIAGLGETMAAGVASIREEMATKTALHGVREDIKGLQSGLREVRDDLKNLNEMMVSKADLAETIRRELDASPFANASEVQDLRERLTIVEQKLGIEHRHNAA